MARRTSAAHDAAKLEYEAAPKNDKPSARQLAARHDLAESTIHRAGWYQGGGNLAEREKAAKAEARKK